MGVEFGGKIIELWPSGGRVKSHHGHYQITKRSVSGCSKNPGGLQYVELAQNVRLQGRDDRIVEVLAPGISRNSARWPWVRNNKAINYNMLECQRRP